jgi:hypothetical protein
MRWASIGSVWLGAVDQFLRPRGVTVAGVSGVPSGTFVGGVVPSLVFRTTHSPPYPCSPRLASSSPLSLSSSSSATAPPTFLAIKEIQDISFISRPKPSLTATVAILRSLLALLYYALKPSEQAAEEGHARFRPAVRLWPIAFLSSLSTFRVSADIDVTRFVSRNAGSRKSDVPKVSINGPDGATVTPQASTSNGITPTPTTASAALLWRVPTTQLDHSPLVMPSFILSVISSRVRSKGSPRRSKPPLLSPVGYLRLVPYHRFPDARVKSD